jgi:pimeloyl-ACP methyl ester carboxylesterase
VPSSELPSAGAAPPGGAHSVGAHSAAEHSAGGSANDAKSDSHDVTGEIRFVPVGDVRLRTRVQGAGDPLLLITGIGASLEQAEPFESEMVARGFRVISFDAPGVGQSTGYRYPQRMPGIARTITGLLDALDLPQVDVLGVSLGGVIAQQFAHQAPDRVRHLVLAATGAGVFGLGGVPGSPRVVLEMATPRR